MPGASEHTQQVKVLNANWTAAADGEDGRFDLMLVTQDGERHTISPSPAAVTALLALAQADTILLWDPENVVEVDLVPAQPAGLTPVQPRSPMSHYNANRLSSATRIFATL